MVKIILKFSPVGRHDRYRGQRRMLKSLRPELLPTITWSAVDTELDQETADVANRTPRVHQLPQCLPIYESAIVRTRPIRMLEIGSYYGDSLQKWQRCLHPDSLIIGIDIDSRILKISNAEGIHVRFGGGTGVGFLRATAAEFGPFDMVVDVASQTTHRMADSFRILFEDALSRKGVYIVEDVYCDIWTLYNSFALFDIFRALLDAIRGHYQIARRVTKFQVGHIIFVRRTAGFHGGNQS